MVEVNRALALAEVHGDAAGLTALDAISDDKVSKARPFHAARARLLERLGRKRDAIAAVSEALGCEPPAAEKLYLTRWRDRLAALD